MRDLTALAGLKSEGRILERQFLLLNAHAIKGQLVGTSSSEAFRMSLQLRRIGGIQGGGAVKNRQFSVQAQSLLSCAHTSNICDISYILVFLFFWAQIEPFLAFLVFYCMYRENHILR